MKAMQLRQTTLAARRGEATARQGKAATDEWKGKNCSFSSTSECTDARLSLNYEGTFVLHSEMSSKKEKIKPVRIVDGHSCLQPKLDEFLPQAAGIVFVVDALEFLPNCRAASKFYGSCNRV